MNTLNLELSVFFDHSQACWLFDENFERVINSRMLEYVDYGNISASYRLGCFENFKFTKQQLIEAMKSYFNIQDLKTKAKYFYDISFSRCTKDQLIEIADSLCYDSKEQDDFLTANFEPLYYVLESRGYSQGDYAEVILTKEYIAYITKECGKALDQLLPALKDEIDHLLWDCPVYARLIINETDEVYLDELLKDPYSYDKDDLLSQFKRVYSGKLDQFDEVYQYLSENLPDNPDYR